MQCAVLDIVGQTIRFILRQATGNWTNLFAPLLFNLVQEYMAQENMTQKYMAQKYMAQKCMGQEYMTQETEYMTLECKYIILQDQFVNEILRHSPGHNAPETLRAACAGPSLCIAGSRSAGSTSGGRRPRPWRGGRGPGPGP